MRNRKRLAHGEQGSGSTRNPEATWFWDAELDGVYRRRRGAFRTRQILGVTILEDLHETEHGGLQYGAEDLDGHHWLFSRHARDVNPEQWGSAVSRAVAPFRAPTGNRYATIPTAVIRED